MRLPEGNQISCIVGLNHGSKLYVLGHVQILNWFAVVVDWDELVADVFRCWRYVVLGWKVIPFFLCE